MALRLPGVAVVVGADRYRAGRRAEAENLGDLFLLDDGFQHRRLHRDVDIVTIDPEEWAGPDRLLPAGRWREPRRAIGRAHAICVPAGAALPGLDPAIPVFEFHTRVDGVGRNGRILPVSVLQGVPVSAFAGIAKPERFFKLLEAEGITLASRVAFGDHHDFSPGELAQFAGGDSITTEKDAARLGEGDFYFLRISANIKHFNGLHDLIRRRIEHV